MMREKTAAERQMEALLKLKKQGGKPVPLPPKPAGPESGSSAPAWRMKAGAAAGGQKRTKNRSKARSLPLSEKSWTALVARFGREGTLRPTQALGDWAALLASRLPDELKVLKDSEWAELIVQLENWCDRRHKKDS